MNALPISPFDAKSDSLAPAGEAQFAANEFSAEEHNAVASYLVLAAANGKEALETLHGHRAEIRLVFTDLMMPIKGGLALIRKAQMLEPGLKFVAMTGLGDMERRAEPASFGVVEIVMKLCGPQEILAALRRQLPTRV